MNRILLISFVAYLSLLSCRSQKLPPPTPIPQPAPAAVVVPENPAAEVMAIMNDSSPAFNWAVMRFSADYTGLDKNRIVMGGQMRIRSDSAIWVSLSPALGIEAARGIISHDSLKFMNRLQGNYLVGPSSLLSQLLMTNVDYNVLEALLMGNDFAYYDDSVFTLDAQGKALRLSTPGRRKLAKQLGGSSTKPTVLIQEMLVDPATYRILKQQIRVVGHEQQKLEVTYDDFRRINDRLIPHNLEMKVSVDGDILLKVSFSRVELDQEQTMPFNIPSSYKPLR